MRICTFRASVTLVCVELFISGRSVERGKMLLQGSNIHGFARGNFVTKACLPALCERSPVFVYCVLLALRPPALSVAEGK